MGNNKKNGKKSRWKHRVAFFIPNSPQLSRNVHTPNIREIEKHKNDIILSDEHTLSIKLHVCKIPTASVLKLSV